MTAFSQTPSGDLDISTGNFSILRKVGPITANKLSNLFAFFKGEWFRDLRQGLPYVQFVLVSNPNLHLISSIFDKVIRSAPGVAAVTSITLDFDRARRTLKAQFGAVANDGSTLVGGIGVPFIVSVKEPS